jgi:hypothetical protein
MISIDNALLIKLYHAQPLSTDKLPYTPEMDALVATYNHSRFHAATHLELYRALINLRKNGKLIARNRKPPNPTRTGLLT